MQQNNKSNLNPSKNGSFYHNMSPYRRTSAEIIHEAKSVLAGGTRLVSTRRPITPREPTRQLYGEKNVPAGRPPSAFSLKYLQYETRALPALDRIPNHEFMPVTRAISAGTSHTLVEKDCANTGNCGTLKGKLPALLTAPKTSLSFNDLNDGQAYNFDIKYKTDPPIMPPLAATPSRISKNLTYESGLIEPNANNSTSIVKNHPLKRLQSKSLDEPIEEIEKKPTNDGNKLVSINKNKGIKELTKTKLTKSNGLLTQSSTETLLEMLKAHGGVKECNEETITYINEILIELYSRIKGARGNWRSTVLGALYGLVECASSKVLLSVARVVLALNVTGSNLTGACKLVFKVARNENNDGLFLEHDVPELLIDGLGRASPHDDPEACIYGYGAIRFLANSAISISLNSSFRSLVEEKLTKVQQKQKSLAYRLARHGAVQLMILHLQMLNEAGSTTKLCGQPLHVLFQLSGALRSLAGVPAMAEIMKMPRSVLHKNPNVKYPQIRETQEAEDIRLELAGPHLVKAAEICIDEPDVQGNLIRTLSILSESEQCCEYLADTAARLGILLGPVGGTNGIPEKSLAVLNRLGYILGNIMSRFDIARLQYYDNDVAMEYLLNTLVYYSTQTLNKSSQKGDTVADVLIKLVRVIANMSVNSHVGYGLGAKAPLGAALLNILLLSKDAKTAEMEELLLATLGALHNLSYYQESSEMSQPIYQAGSMIERIKDISSTLCAVLNGDVVVAKAEAARVLGNLTRNYTARQTFCSVGGLRAIVRCLASDDFELIATACGVLVNILSDWERRGSFRELKGPQMLREVLEKSVLQEDWMLSAIVGQAMWNYLIDSDNVIGALGETETDNLAGILAEYIDEEKIFEGETPDIMWEQFALVASDLLERIQSCLSGRNSPYRSDDDDIVVNVRQMKNCFGESLNPWLEE